LSELDNTAHSLIIELAQLYSIRFNYTISPELQKTLMPKTTNPALITTKINKNILFILIDYLPCTSLYNAVGKKKGNRQFTDITFTRGLI